jgi:hypothetical protein
MKNTAGESHSPPMVRTPYKKEPELYFYPARGEDILESFWNDGHNKKKVSLPTIQQQQQHYHHFFFVDLTGKYPSSNNITHQPIQKQESL